MKLGAAMILSIYVFNFIEGNSAIAVRYNRTVIEERDMFREEAEEWQHQTHAFIRTCGKSGSFGVEPRKCPAGVILKEPFKPGCVCVRGVWIVHFELCSAAAIIIVGGAHGSSDCYYIDSPVRSFNFIGDVEDPFKLKAFVTPISMTVFHEVPLDGSWTPLLDFRDPVFLIIRRGRDPPIQLPAFEDEEDSFCFRAREEANRDSGLNDSVVIWTTALLPSRYRRVMTNCADPDNFGYDAYATYKEYYHYGFRGHPDIGLGCFEPCSVWPNGRPLLWDSKEERRMSRNLTTTMTFSDWQQVFRQESEERRRSNKFGTRGRKKRRVANCEMVWEGRAYCMKSYWEPLEKFEMTEKEKNLCYPPVGQVTRGAYKYKRYG